MRIAEIRLKNFKRFTDLVIRGIPPTAKLVLVVGPNGCGKSSLFDALLQWYRNEARFGHSGDEQYYRKNRTEPFDWRQAVSVALHGGENPRRGCLYVRSAYRNDPDFSISGFNRPASPTENVRLNRVIDNDQAVSENYQRLLYDTMSAVYDEENDSKTVRTLREELIGEIRESMKRVFGDLVLNNISDPLGSGAFFFDKGAAKWFHYKNLSGGEKAAFDLLLDLHVKKRFYGDAIYCVDEVETHLHTRVQGTIVRDMVRILPDSSQLWIATHSLGVIRAAQEMAASSRGSVCILDFDGVDPDVPRELMPSSLNRVSWEKMLSVALGDLSPRIAPGAIVVCEGSSLGNRRRDFDAAVYSRILSDRWPEIVFVSGGASTQVGASGVSVRETFGRVLPITQIIALRDRDDMSDAEVAEWEQRGNLVLGERNLESYLFADDVIKALLQANGKLDALPEAIALKEKALESIRAQGRPGDDLKSAAGLIYVGLKHLLNLQRCGNTADAFMRDTLAPLIEPPMPTYEALKAAIVDRVRDRLSDGVADPKASMGDAVAVAP